jgi:acyl-CoA thioesterase FadM
VNAPARLNPTPRLEDFPYRLTDNVRFADLDPNQHVNNAVYATYFETGRVTLGSQLRTDAARARLDAGAPRYPFPCRTALAGQH